MNPTYVYHYDGNGNVVRLTDTNGAVVTTLDYDPFGRVLASPGPYTPRYQFPTKEYDGVVGLNYYGFRYYAPQLGRFLSRDPIGELGAVVMDAHTKPESVSARVRSWSRSGRMFSHVNLATWVRKPVLDGLGAVDVYINVRNAPTFMIDPDGRVAATCPTAMPPTSDPCWCLDDVFSPITHPGETCFHEVASDKEEGAQCCYDADGDLTTVSPDKVNPSCGRKDNGKCDWSFKRICKHCVKDVLGL